MTEEAYLPGFEPPPEKFKLRKDTQYIAVSQLQKAVRMGLPEDAVRAARLLWLDNPWRLFVRLHVILGEDLGRDHALIDFAISFYESGHSFKNWESVAMLVVMMASSQAKSHEVNYSKFAMAGDDFDPMYFIDGSPLNLLSKSEVRGLIEDFDSISMEQYQKIMSPFASEEVTAGIYRIVTRIDCSEKQLRFYPLWRSRDEGKTLKTVDEVAANPQLLRRHGNVLINAIDSHTGCGKMAFNTICKRYPYEDAANLSTYEWAAVASRMNHAVVDRPLEDRWMAIHARGLDWFTSNLKNVMDVREWFLLKKGAEVISDFENVPFE